MDVRTELEKMKEMGWTVADFIELIKVIEEDGIIVEDNKKETSILNTEELSEKNEDTYEDYKEYLFKLGIMPRLRGFCYLNEVIQEDLLNNAFRKEGIRKLCDRIAKRNNVKTYTVISCIRTAIRSGWENTDKSVWKDILEKDIVEVPTVSEFVIMFSQRIRRNATLTDLNNLNENDIKIRERCEVYLDRLEMLQTLKGYYFLKEVVLERMKLDIELPLKFVYRNVAKKHQIDEKSVERTIRTTIKRAWNKGDSRIWEETLGIEKINKCPTNTQVISILSFLVRNDMGLIE